MVMRRKRVFVIVLVMLFGAGLAMFLLTRDSGPPVVVQGNFSAKDVAEIKSVVKRELWHEVRIWSSVPFLVMWSGLRLQQHPEAAGGLRRHTAGAIYISLLR
jgi:hypothetical protein